MSTGSGSTTEEEGPLNRRIRERREAELAASPTWTKALEFQKWRYERGELHENVDEPYSLPPAVQRAVDLLRIVFED